MDGRQRVPAPNTTIRNRTQKTTTNSNTQPKPNRMGPGVSRTTSIGISSVRIAPETWPTDQHVHIPRVEHPTHSVAMGPSRIAVDVTERITTWDRHRRHKIQSTRQDNGRRPEAFRLQRPNPMQRQKHHLRPTDRNRLNMEHRANENMD